MSVRPVPTSRWGSADEAGAANEIGPEQVLNALRLARRGETFDLTQTISVDSPRMSMMSPYSLCMWSHPIASQRALEADGARNGAAFADERVEMDLHIATHIDSLGHCWIGEEGFNRRRMLDAVGNWGLLQLGIENLPPLITRGVLLDVAGVRGELSPGHVISPDDLEATIREESVAIEPGDLVLVRTGWGRYYSDDKQAYLGKAPGLGVAAASWLADMRVSVIGTDTMAFEVLPPEDASAPWAVHQELLARRGVYILENAALDAIANARHHTFLCVCFALKFRGGTASPVRLVAIV